MKTKRCRFPILGILALALFQSLETSCATKATPEETPAVSVATTIPFGQMKQWLYFDRAGLDGFSAERGTLDFSDRYPFNAVDGTNSDYALRWRYEPGSVLTYKCDVMGDLGFNISLLTDVPDVIGKEMKIEFMEGDKVFASAPFAFYRQYWNRWEFGRNRGVKTGDFAFEGRGATALESPCAPVHGTKLTSIRITAPKDAAGEIYLGFIYVGLYALPTPPWGDHRAPTQWPWNIDITEESVPLAHKVAKPVLPSPTKSEMEGVSTIEQRVEKSLLKDSAYSGAARAGDINEWIEKCQQKYKLLNIQQTAGGGMRGGINVTINWMQSINKTGFSMNGMESKAGYCSLMYATAICYRETSDPVKKAGLLEMYHNLFDYSVYLGTMPNSWFGGEGYMESVFLMRDDLRATHRFTEDLLNYWTLRFGYSRIFNAKENHSARDLFGDNVSPGFVFHGEDADYTRITMPGLILYSLLMPDEAERVRDLHALRDWLGNVVFSCAPGAMDTFKPDGSGFHHGGFLFRYQSAAVYECAKMLYLLSKTDFAIKPERQEFIRNILLKQYHWSYRNNMPATIPWKGPFSPRDFQQSVPLSAYCLMALAGTPDGKEKTDTEFASIYLRQMADGNTKCFPVWEQETAEPQFAAMGIQPAPKDQGHWTLSYNASAIHRRPDWQLYIKGYSKYFFAREAQDAGNTFGFGLCELRTPDMFVLDTNRNISGYCNIGQAGYDWMKLPGTTMVQLPMSALMKGQAERSDRAFVGGVDSPDGNGVFALDLHCTKRCDLENFYAKKTWFCFGDAVVCLGSGIRDSHPDFDTHTTLFQNPINAKATPTFVNDTAGITAQLFESEISKTSWLVDNLGTGYYLFDKQVLHVQRKKQNCRDISDKLDTSGTYESAWLAHGCAPTNASYRYVMRPMTTPDKMAAFSQDMQRQAPFEILRQDDEAHIVHSRADNSTGYVLFDTAVALSDDELLTASKPCVVMLRHENGILHCSVADPDLNMPSLPIPHGFGYSQPSTITLTLNGHWQVTGGPSVTVAADSGKTKLTVTCHDGLTTTVNLTPTTKEQ